MGDIKEELSREMMRKLDSLSDTDAKNLVQSLSINFQVKENKIKLPPNIQMMQTMAYLCSKKLSGGACKILFFFMGLSEYENVISMDQQTIMDDLNVSRSNVKRSLKELEDNGVLIKSKYMNDNRRNEYILNPVGSWKGNSRSRRMILTKMMGGDPNQTTMFGESVEDSLSRESVEIRSKDKSFQNRIESFNKDKIEVFPINNEDWNPYDDEEDED